MVDKSIKLQIKLCHIDIYFHWLKQKIQLIKHEYLLGITEIKILIGSIKREDNLREAF